MSSYKEKARAAIAERAREKNLCDSRNVAFCATATKLPNGEYGIVFLSLNGNSLYISDVDMRNNIGGMFYSVPLSEAVNFKISKSLFSQNLGFEYNGGVFRFTNISGLNDMLEVIKREAEKR